MLQGPPDYSHAIAYFSPSLQLGTIPISWIAAPDFIGPVGGEKPPLGPWSLSMP